MCAIELRKVITGIDKVTIMPAKYSIDIDLDTISLAGLKKLARVALKIRETIAKNPRRTTSVIVMHASQGPHRYMSAAKL